MEGREEGRKKPDGRKCSGFLNPSAIVQVIYFIVGHLFAGTSVSVKLFATTAVMAVISMVGDRQISSLQTAFSIPVGASPRPAEAAAALSGHWWGSGGLCRGYDASARGMFYNAGS